MSRYPNLRTGANRLSTEMSILAGREADCPLVLKELPKDWYDPDRYGQIFGPSSQDWNPLSDLERQKCALLVHEYNSVMQQYENMIYNDLWVQDHPIRGKLSATGIMLWRTTALGHVREFMHRNLFVSSVRNQSERDIVHARDVDRAVISFYSAISERSCAISSKAVEIAVEWSTFFFALAFVIYGVRSGLFLDYLGLEFIDGVLSRK